MSRSPHSLKIYSPRTGTTYTVSLYNTKEEANNYNACFPLHIDNQTLYAAYDGYLGEFPSGGATPLRVQKNGAVFQVVQHGFHYLQIQQSANQTITCTANGQSWIDGSVHFFPYGTQWHATVSGHPGWNAGALNATDGTLINSDVILLASPATLAIPSGTLVIPASGATWMCPQYINRIKTHVGVFDYYYDVTAGNSYTITYQRFLGTRQWCINNNAWVSTSTSSITIEWGPHINK